MSNNPGLREKFNFRGSPSDTDDFYMLAVLKKKYISGNDGDSIKAKNVGNFNFLGDEADKYFFLCHNQYLDTTRTPGTFYDRLYWSADPDDFQYNDSEGYKNQGVARMNAAYINGNLRLRYRSSFNGYSSSKKDQTVYRNVGPDFDKLDINEKESIIVSFNTKNDTNLQNYALKGKSLFYSIPYTIESKSTLYSINSPTTFNSIQWSFRKYQESPVLANSTKGITVHTEGANNKDSAFNFVYLQDLTNATGASQSNFNYGSTQYYVANTTMGTCFYDSATSFSVADTDDLINSNFYLVGGSIIKITPDDGTNTSTVVNYTHTTKLGTSLQFHTSGASSRGLLGRNYQIDINSGVSIYINQRNVDTCFTPLSNDSTFSEWFDIYLLPVEENMYLPGSHHTNDPTLFPESCSLYGVGDLGENAITPTQGTQSLLFFSPQTNEPFTIEQVNDGTMITNPNPYFTCTGGDTQAGYNIHKDTDYRKIYNLLFFFLIGSLKDLYWKVTNRAYPLTTTTSGYDTHPNIAVEPELNSSGKIDNKITFYGWDTHAESSAAYMFNYCRGSDVCGICSGNNKDGENICFADKLTRDNAVKSNLPNRNAYPPLTGKERPTGTHSNPGNHLPTFVIVIIAVLVVALIVTIIAVAYVKRKKWRENSV